MINPGEWAAHNLGCDFVGVHAVFSVHNQNQELVGAAVLHDRSKYNVELSYYGPGTITMGLLKAIAVSALDAGFLRISVKVRTKRMARHMTRIGLKYEGRQADMYGPGKDALLYCVSAPLLLKLARRA